MAVNASNIHTDLFDAMVKHEYQSHRKLKGATRERTAAGSATVYFPKMGEIQAYQHTPGTDVLGQDAGESRVQALMTNWLATIYAADFDETKTNVTLRSEYAKITAKAIGRRSDQIVLEALQNASGNTSIGEDVGGTDSNLNLAKILKAQANLNAANVEPGDRFFVAHAAQKESLLAEEKATSGDYVEGMRRLGAGEIDTFLGFKFIWLGDMTEGGLVKTGNIRKVYAFQKQAVGYATNMDIKSAVDRIPEKQSWLVSTAMSAGAVSIEGAGIVEVSCQE